MLLDSNVLLFWNLGLSRISRGAEEALISAPSLSLSVASVWALEIKRGLGKLLADIDWHETLRDQLILLPVEIEDAVEAGALPLHHRDPFARMIVAQAKRRGLPIVTRDRAFGDYGVPVIWA
ncbi:type II toxin-antitoxin system VapC family toxin [Methylopila sp. 73B]|uniref:type II toxin-antitoxin system VapC family toxin n=1 Tax=Methylopila sp. 73B TaxID=1120792 RepID=UPI0009DE7358|nr:type II toxin-antitoxin system VapC family toxin [Methylopila sp. 73B]